MPSEAIEALENDVGGLVQTIIQMRAFSFTKHQYENATKIENMPTGTMAELVVDIEFESVKKKKENV